MVIFRTRLHDGVTGMLICMYKYEYLYGLVAHMRRAAVWIVTKIQLVWWDAESIMTRFYLKCH